MIDLETLGTTADAVILSIGAVRFDLEEGRVFDSGPHDCCFYRAIEIDWQPGRRIDGDTLTWWMKQDAQAQQVFTDPAKKILAIALHQLAMWIDPQPGSMPTVWSNGADFDLPMLSHAYRQHSQTPPWEPYAARCYRTYKNLPGARAVKVERTGLHHNALDDAIYQAQHLCAIHAALFGRSCEMDGVEPFVPVSLHERAQP